MYKAEKADSFTYSLDCLNRKIEINGMHGYISVYNTGQ